MTVSRSRISSFLFTEKSGLAQPASGTPGHSGVPWDALVDTVLPPIPDFPLEVQIWGLLPVASVLTFVHLKSWHRKEKESKGEGTGVVTGSSEPKTQMDLGIHLGCKTRK